MSFNLKFKSLIVYFLVFPLYIFSVIKVEDGGRKVYVDDIRDITSNKNISFDFSQNYPEMESLQLHLGNYSNGYKRFFGGVSSDLGISNNVNLKKIEFSDISFSEVLRYSSLPSLESLKIDNRVNFLSFEWDFLISLTALKELSIDDCSNSSMTSLLENVQICQNIQSLNLSATGFLFYDWTITGNTEFRFLPNSIEQTLLSSLTHLKNLTIFVHVDSAKDDDIRTFSELEKEVQTNLPQAKVKMAILERWPQPRV